MEATAAIAIKRRNAEIENMMNSLTSAQAKMRGVNGYVCSDIQVKMATSMASARLAISLQKWVEQRTETCSVGIFPYGDSELEVVDQNDPDNIFSGVVNSAGILRCHTVIRGQSVAGVWGE